MLKELLEPEIKELLAENDLDSVREIVVMWQEVETADLICSIDNKYKSTLFNILPHEYSVDVFSELSLHDQELLIKNMDDKKISSILYDLTPDDRTALLEELPLKDSSKILPLLKDEDRNIAYWLLGFPEYSIGRLMTPQYISINQNYTVSKAFEYVRENIEEAETYATIFILDDDKRLLGSISLRILFFSDKNALLSDVLDKSCPSITAYDEQEKAIDIFKKYNINELAVVDHTNSMLGIVTVDDILDVAQEEYTEDFHKMAAINSTNNKFDEDIKHAPLILLYKRRIPWLLILVCINIVSGAIISLFQGTIEKNIILVIFLPLLIAVGGNAGSQSAILIIRSLSIGDIYVSDWSKMLLKEVLVSTALGISMALIASLLGLIRTNANIALIVGISMFSTVFTGCIIGVSIPFILTKFKIDPATSGAPILTSICDIIGTAIYFITANIVFSILA